MPPSNLPPGVTNRAVEDAAGADTPPACEDCDYLNEVNGTGCPYGFHFEYCPKVEIIQKCGHCGKPINKVPGVIPDVVAWYHPLYGCSPACAKEIQKKVPPPEPDETAFNAQRLITVTDGKCPHCGDKLEPAGAAGLWACNRCGVWYRTAHTDTDKPLAVPAPIPLDILARRATFLVGVLTGCRLTLADTSKTDKTRLQQLDKVLADTLPLIKSLPAPKWFGPAAYDVPDQAAPPKTED